MKYLSLALVVSTLIFCACKFGPEALKESREMDLKERELAIKERNVHVQFVFVQQAPRPRGMQAEPPAKAKDNE